MSSPAILTASGSGRRRAPPQVSHGWRGLVVADSSSRIQALSVDSMRRSRLPMHALERLLHLIALRAVDEAQGDRAAAGAAEDDVARLLGQLAPRRVERRSHIRGRGCRAPACNKARAAGYLAQGTTAPFLMLSAWLGTTRSSSNSMLLAEAVAGRAGALRRVEREEARLDLGDGEAARPGRRISRRR